MEYYNDTLCVSARELIDAGILTQSNYDKLNQRKQIRVVRRACRNTSALVDVNSLPYDYKLKMHEEIGNPKDMTPRQQFPDLVQQDPAAWTFFSAYRKPDGGSLSEDRIREYCNNAAVLNALHERLVDKKHRMKATGSKLVGFWEKAARTLSEIKEDFGHTLPDNPRRLKERYKRYIDDGYTSLISGLLGNSNSRVVTDAIENIILSIYCMKNKPYSKDVHTIYMQFMQGMVSIADVRTGELFNRIDFYDKKGCPVVISESTVWNYINDPKNRAVIDKYRLDQIDYASTIRPHHIRHSPKWSLSKVSTDDRDLPRKMHDGRTVKAYYAYDVCSGALIGYSYSKTKDTALFIDCLRNMFRFLDGHGLGMPAEMEVEHHIVNKFKDDMMRANVLFSFVRWCNPGNSQEKRAEHFHKAKKYGYEKRYQDGIGRFYLKIEANRPKREKIFDESNDHYKEKTFDYDQLVADDIYTIMMYNNGLHRDQKKYPGKTRLQVLLEHVTPLVINLDHCKLARYIGECTSTSIRRSMYVTVQYNKYRLSRPEVLESLLPHNYSVKAYYMPSDDIKEVYIFQNDVYVDTCKLIEGYNEATAEQTDADRAEYTNQAKYVSQFDAMVKEGKLPRVAIIPEEQPTELVAASPSPMEAQADDDAEEIDYVALQQESKRLAKMAALQSL